MLHFLRCILLCSVLGLHGAAHCYAIDASCDSNMELVEKLVASAFDLSQVAYDAIAVQDINAVDQNIKDLMKWLFSPDEDYVRVKTELAIRFAGINSQNVKDSLNYPNVIFYCDTTRFERRKVDNEVVWVEKVLSPPGTDEAKEYMAIVRDENGNSFDPEKECKGIGLNPFEFGNKITNMVTINMVGRHSQVQICPWLLDYINKKEFKDTHSWKTWGVGKVARLMHLKELVAWKDYRPVDLLFLFEKMILHELTHTYGAKETTDVGNWNGYGWKNCRALSYVEEYKGPAVPKDEWIYGAFSNADSIALFALAVDAQTKGFQIHEDGQVDKPASET